MSTRILVLVALALAGCPIPSTPIPAGPDEVPAPGCDGGLLYGGPPPPYTLAFEGTTYTVRNGQVWKPTTAGNGQLLATLYDPHFAAMFSVEGCQIFRFTEDKSQKSPVGKSFTAEFENAADVQGLLGVDAGFTGFVLQSPQAPTVPDYVALRSCLLARTCSFKDNRLELLAAAAHDGVFGLRATSVGPTAAMQTAKASIESELVHFVRGDVVKLGAWYRVVEGQPYGLLDLESAIIDLAPGPRILLEGDHLEIELKFGEKPRYKQASPKPFPLGPWVRVEVEYRLEPDATGEIRLWQDGELIIDAKGRRCLSPTPFSIHSSWASPPTAQRRPCSMSTVSRSRSGSPHLR